MKIAISGETPGKQYTLEQIAQYIKQYGAEGIEIWPENIPPVPSMGVHPRLYEGRDIAKAKEILEKYGIQAACVAFGGGFDASIAKDEQLFAAELKKAVLAAKALGARFVNHYLYYVSMDDAAELSRLKRIYEPAIQCAAENSIILVLEDEAHDSTKNPQEMKRIVDAMHSPNFMTNYDAVNYYQAGFEGFPYAYEVLKEKIAYVHIKDGCLYAPEHGHTKDSLGGYMTGAMAGKTIFYPMIGTGMLNIHGVLNALQKDGYDGWCTLEPHTTVELWHKYITAEVSFLKDSGHFKT